MGKYIIEGQRKLRGEIDVQGSKNSALPILAATVLCKGVSVIHNCPRLLDIAATINILEHLGCKVKREGSTVIVDSTDITRYDIPENLMHEMRSSIIFLGAVLGRLGKANISTPGGCEIGLRPINLHLDAMEKFGVELEEGHGRLEFTAKNGLKAATITLSFPSVGATENIILAASTAVGTTVIINAAREPEISDLADFLNGCGARISGAGESTVVIEGVKSLSGTEHTVIPDRIAAATYMGAAAITQGSVTLRNIIPSHLGSVISVFEEMGCDISINGRNLTLVAPSRLQRVKTIRTMPYPGFPTDLQAPVMALTSVAKGTSVIIETIFENRFKHVGQLARLGAKIMVDGRTAVVEGVDRLTGAEVVSPDLRGGCALVLAGLSAKGTTVVDAINHIDRGYDGLEDVLSSMGANIKRVE
ncbi:MAG: UDP-N-acetylglucosamine 1-carboxyvinyltransferase [Clostridiales bacterium]|jgi:UDP-N-acetylglucosamine 1-carboxyvinyltransferase|nr:UDP-N-acetylglucosamine 1-carboxyvinyltransferase [Clostridiales bacterium]HOA33962.1 UDP-N-acetylglucosamine 1-carboxyvinyltransferase [Clostridiales bacterium]HOJ35178.1 UDP-N-acetylglucosamine 1-carboxyvinyltransferase [Clostridiales bacterium]HOL78882.1 UDP-N-acetylglucosamine 1-carboxyvinyltransferase [Clostridiales bacterium]HPU67922.1 UDP-N-acetylglucosamine 1-carboxyvinyltransferase [Clostridiales bacterium]